MDDYCSGGRQTVSSEQLAEAKEWIIGTKEMTRCPKCGEVYRFA